MKTASKPVMLKRAPPAKERPNEIVYHVYLPRAYDIKTRKPAKYIETPFIRSGEVSLIPTTPEKSGLKEANPGFFDEHKLAASSKLLLVNFRPYSKIAVDEDLLPEKVGFGHAVMAAVEERVKRDHPDVEGIAMVTPFEAMRKIAENGGYTKLDEWGKLDPETGIRKYSRWAKGIRGLLTLKKRPGIQGRGSELYHVMDGRKTIGKIHLIPGRIADACKKKIPKRILERNKNYTKGIFFSVGIDPYHFFSKDKERATRIMKALEEAVMRDHPHIDGLVINTDSEDLFHIARGMEYETLIEEIAHTDGPLTYALCAKKLEKPKAL